MPARTDDLDLERLQLVRGEGRRLVLAVAPGRFDLWGEPYDVEPALPEAVLDIDRTASGGYALRLRFGVELAGRCMRCLEAAHPPIEVDVREVDQPGGGDELSSPYMNEEGVLDVQGWARDALALELPKQVLCRPDCAGLCPVCGKDLNIEPHEHERAPDPRWAKLRELELE